MPTLCFDGTQLIDFEEKIINQQRSQAVEI
jgi:hypothetical protein